MLWPDNIVQQLDAINITREGLAEHEADKREEFARLREVIDGGDARSILDIGCGLAVLDVLIVQAFPSIKSVYLIDGDRREQSRGGYFPAGRPWADVRMGAEMVETNCPDVKVFPYVAPNASDWFMHEVDIILSARSWGHHYPVGAYAALARRFLAPGGVIIMDIRAGSPGLSEMHELGFRPCAKIEDASTKCARFAFERVPA